MCFCTDMAAYSKFDAGRILLKSREVGDGGGGGVGKADAKKVEMLVPKIE